jgi:hypothetical protein
MINFSDKQRSLSQCGSDLGHGVIYYDFFPPHILVLRHELVLEIFLFIFI